MIAFHGTLKWHSICGSVCSFFCCSIIKPKLKMVLNYMSLLKMNEMKWCGSSFVGNHQSSNAHQNQMKTQTSKQVSYWAQTTHSNFLLCNKISSAAKRLRFSDNLSKCLAFWLQTHAKWRCRHCWLWSIHCNFPFRSVASIGAPLLSLHFIY